MRLNIGSQPEKWKVFYPCLIYVSYSLYLFCAAVMPGKFQEAWGGVGGDVAIPGRMRKLKGQFQAFSRGRVTSLNKH